MAPVIVWSGITRTSRGLWTFLAARTRACIRVATVGVSSRTALPSTKLCQVPAANRRRCQRASLIPRYGYMARR
jgi:hypothetical protein